ncbi:hypothetical protein A0256_17545 [Mucilaginibacter sp. PAMC 26640]|nr:hypothetical protein A0256_17545 [Mucilaginibacter sp. PAMC 26640]
MTTLLRFEFDTKFFYTDYSGPRNIIIENPPHVPQTGDPISFVIEQFFDDDQVIAAYTKLTQNYLFQAERVETKFSKAN